VLWQHVCSTIVSISKVSLPVLLNLTQNLMHTLCSSTSAIRPISENRRRLMQYTHKDTCNNQTLPHPTTPLGILTHKTPPQHTLAGNSWTTSDMCVMSIVLGLLDTPCIYVYIYVIYNDSRIETCWSDFKCFNVKFYVSALVGVIMKWFYKMHGATKKIDKPIVCKASKLFA